jgi:small conductance mechanosensitive channel
MEQNIVTKVVTDEIDITTRFIDGMTNFAMTKGVDLIEGILIFLMGYVICRYIRRVVEHILTKSDVDPSAKTFIEEIIFFFCLAIVSIVALGTAGVGNGTLAAAFGGIGLAIGLGLKDNIGNVASGIFILIFRPFRVGDYIQIGTSQGTVTSISIMYTMLSTLGNQRIVVPNSSLTKTVIKNFSTNNIRNLEYTFDVGYDTDLKACIALLKKVFTESPYVVEKEKLAVYVSEMAESSIRIYVRASVDRTQYYEALNAMYIEVKENFDAAGIDIPYPQLVVHQAKDSSN